MAVDAERHVEGDLIQADLLIFGQLVDHLGRRPDEERLFHLIESVRNIDGADPPVADAARRFEHVVEMTVVLVSLQQLASRFILSGCAVAESQHRN